jgi:intracellular protein transport protein USO1
MDFFSQTYNSLRGPVGAQQNPLDTIARLSDRLSPSTLLADRRAAVLSLKGLSRDCKHDVGERALPGLLQVLQDDASVDADIGKAVLETLNILCDPEDGNAELARKHTDVVLSNEKPTHSLLALLGDDQFYLRLASLQLLGTLLQQRRQIVQKYFLNAPTGPAGVIAIIDDKREIIRNGMQFID